MPFVIGGFTDQLGLESPGERSQEPVDDAEVFEEMPGDKEIHLFFLQVVFSGAGECDDGAVGFDFRDVDSLSLAFDGGFEF